MEIHIQNQPTLPSAQQSQSATSTTNQTGSVDTLQKSPDNVVAAASDVNKPNVRDDDAARRQEKSSIDLNVKRFNDQKLVGVKARIGYDREDKNIYLEILMPKTDEVMQRIPSKEFATFLASQVTSIKNNNHSLGFEAIVNQSI